MCVLAAVLEILCGLCVPFFFKEAFVDSSGNHSVHVGTGESLVGASLLSLTRYLALLGLHIGVLGICVGVFTLTPETAMLAREEARSWWPVVRSLGWTSVLLLVACILSSAKVVGYLVKLVIESVDRVFLNTDIIVGSALLSFCRGRILIRDLVVMNPLGSEFTTGRLLKIDVISVKVNAWLLLKSFGGEFELQSLIVDGVEVNYELGNDGQNSNVGKVVEYIEQNADGAVQVEQNADGAAQDLPPEEASNFQMVIGHVLIKNSFARIVHPEFGEIARLDLGVIDRDFSKGDACKAAHGVVLVVLGSVLRSALGSYTLVGSVLRKKVVGKCFEPIVGCLSGVTYSGSAGKPSVPKSK